MSKKVLVIVTNVGVLAGEANGTYLPELTHVLDVLSSNHVDYDLVSPQGGNAPYYGDDDSSDVVTQAWLGKEGFIQSLGNTLAITDVQSQAYSAVFYPGGYGLLFDVANNLEIALAARQVYEANGVVSAVCHGPAALYSILLTDGTPLVAGKQVTGFTRDEEIDMGTLEKIPFLVEDKLIEKSARYTKVKAWDVNVINDNRVITGQNPGSAHRVGEVLVEQLQNL